MRTKRLVVPVASALLGALVGWLAAGARAVPVAGEGSGDANAAEIAALRERVRDLESRPRPVLEPGPRGTDATPRARAKPAAEAEGSAPLGPDAGREQAQKEAEARAAALEKAIREALGARAGVGPGADGTVPTPIVIGFGPNGLTAGPPPDLSLDLAATRSLLERGTDEERARALRRLEHADDASWVPLVNEALGSTPPPSNAGGLMNRLSELKDPGHGWSAKQATGAPDTILHGDFSTAWAPKREEMGEVTLDLSYAQAVRVDGVSLHETFNPGAVARILAWTPEGTWELLWEGTGARADVPVWFAPSVRATTYRTARIRVILDTDRVPGWNEIDAVELIGDGIRQWANEATASSEYSGTQ